MHFQEAIIIDRPVAAVWAFLQQPNSEAAWHPDVIEEKITSPGGLGVGATGIEVRKFFGRRMEFPWKITQFVPGRSVTTRRAGGPVVWEAPTSWSPSRMEQASSSIIARGHRVFGDCS